MWSTNGHIGRMRLALAKNVIAYVHKMKSLPYYEVCDHLSLFVGSFVRVLIIFSNSTSPVDTLCKFPKCRPQRRPPSTLHAILHEFYCTMEADYQW